MIESNVEKGVAAATAYENLHVPALFAQWCEPVLDSIAVHAGQRVLDVACGTGILARAALARVGSHGNVSGIDPDPGMLAVARRLAPNVDWQRGTAESLPFDDAQFDAGVSQFGLMFFTDRVRALSEMLRVVRIGGKLSVAVWDALERSPAYPIEVAILDDIAGREAADALRAPFVLGDPNELMRLFESAGANRVSVTTRIGRARFPDLRTMVEADLRGWLPVMNVVLDQATIARILDETDVALRQYVTGDGAVVFDTPAHIVTAERA